MYARNKLSFVSERGGSGTRERARGRRALPKALMAVALAGCLGAASVGSAQAAEAIIADGPVSTSGVYGTYVNLTQIDLRSLDGHSSCLHAYSPTSGWTADWCTNGLYSAPYGGVYRIPHIYSGWSGNSVSMRGRQYW